MIEALYIAAFAVFYVHLGPQGAFEWITQGRAEHKPFTCVKCMAFWTALLYFGQTQGWDALHNIPLTVIMALLIELTLLRLKGYGT